MKLQLTETEMKLLKYYGISNFNQLQRTYAVTHDSRLLPIINASLACITAMSEYAT